MFNVSCLMLNRQTRSIVSTEVLLSLLSLPKKASLCCCLCVLLPAPLDSVEGNQLFCHCILSNSIMTCFSFRTSKEKSLIKAAYHVSLGEMVC